MSTKQKYIKTDLNRLDSIADEKIDYSDIPSSSAKDWANADIEIAGKKAISLRVDEDVLSYYRSKGKGYQTLMNKVLRLYMDAHK